jgi:hypothetical protein
MPEAIAARPRKRRRDAEANRRHQRAFYWRKRQGLRSTRQTFVYDDGMVAMLLRDGWLSPSEIEDPTAIGKAIDRLVKHAMADNGGWKLPR